MIGIVLFWLIVFVAIARWALGPVYQRRRREIRLAPAWRHRRRR